MWLFEKLQKKKPFISLPEGAKRHATYIEGRDELFATKVLRVPSQKRAAGKEIAVFSRDPGSAGALIPIIRLLGEKGIGFSIVTDGRAEEAFRGAFPNVIDVPLASPLAIESTIKKPDLILTDTSASDRGLETSAAATFPEVPIVIVEDYYTTANNYIKRLKEMHPAHMPAQICVMDPAARDIVLAEFPELKDRIHITGQPAFDRFAHENTLEIRNRVRNKLGILPSDWLISYAATIEQQIEEVTAVAPQLYAAQEYFANTGGKLYVAFCRHMRDNVPEQTYRNILTAAGVTVINDAAISYNDVMAAADVVMTGWSTAGLDAAHRRIPVLYLNDRSVRTPPDLVRWPLPPVLLGASTAATHMEDVPTILKGLFVPSSDMVKSMKEAMRQHFKVDGQNALRVATVIEDILNKSSH